ncbi:spore coat protein [Bacillus chungangensis]|uniref:Spore coat protein D n=1 Tax=Bacillus chungangensis TaxID=587633 RepID=A0ABT9WS78_9BACI|nr:spore coat protein [Bacillus chungangensis]MDQ0176155.1 spore coat protein D [Bacillus chungangensis]
MYSHCGPTVLPAVVHPTKCCVNNTYQKFIVPHIHPSHTTNVNHTLYQHQHYFPHTESAVSDVKSQHLLCGPRPKCPPYGWGR